MKFLLLITILFSLGLADINGKIDEYCKIKASIFESERLYKHEYNICSKKLLNEQLSIKEINERIQNDSLQSEKRKQLKEKNKKIFAKKIIGKWQSNYANSNYKLILYYKHNRLFLEEVHKTFTMPMEVTTKKVYNGTQIYDIEGKHFGEYYLLTPYNDLQFWNKTRSYYTAKKIEITGNKIKSEPIKAKVKKQYSSKHLQLVYALCYSQQASSECSNLTMRLDTQRKVEKIIGELIQGPSSRYGQECMKAYYNSFDTKRECDKAWDMYGCFGNKIPKLIQHNSNGISCEY